MYVLLCPLEAGRERRRLKLIIFPRTVDLVDFPGDEPNAAVRYRFIRHFGSALLAAYDAGQ